MKEILPPLTSWACRQGMATAKIDYLRRSYVDETSIGDAYDFTIMIETPHEVEIDIQIEHHYTGSGEPQIRCCQTIITPRQDNGLKPSYIIAENAHYFPHTTKIDGQQSQITLEVYGQTVPATMISELTGKPLSMLAQMPQNLARLLKRRKIHSITNLDNRIIITTFPVTGPKGRLCSA